MIKIILSIVFITIVFSGCVGTLVSNDKATKSNSSVAKGLNNNLDLNKTVNEPQKR